MDLVMAIVVLLLSIVCAVISVLQFKEKGFCSIMPTFTHQSRNEKTWIKLRITGSLASYLL